MRAIDWNTAIAVRDVWHGKGDRNAPLCPLLLDLDRLLKYLDDIDLRPGHALMPCPECGDDHRWSLLKELMVSALALRPAESSRLLKEVDEGLEQVRMQYGGREKYEQMCREAEQYFARVGVDHVYRP